MSGAVLRPRVELGDAPSGPRILYLAHDLADPSVARRVEMLRAGGAEVALAGFTRRDPPPSLRPTPVVLGRTRDGRMLQRLAIVAKGLVGVRRMLHPTLAASRLDVIIARNLEMLALAHRLASASGTPVVYEGLDVHSLLLRSGPEGHALRAVERVLANRSVLLLTSSPAFVSQHFRPSGIDTPVQLVENRVFPTPPSESDGAMERPGEGGPIRIGWFGALRCRASFDALAAFTRAHEGRFEVVMRGRPATGVLDDLPELATAEPHMRFEGPYAYPDDLAAIYAEVDLVWAIDFYEAGRNSDWLLPNRLYEGGLHHAVPIAVDGTQTARFLNDHGIGIVLPDIGTGALELLGEVTRERVASLSQAVRALPRETWVCEMVDCERLVGRIADAAGTPIRERGPAHALAS